MNRDLIIGVTGASGAGVALTLLRSLVGQEAVDRIHLVLSDAALSVVAQEMKVPNLTTASFVERFLKGAGRVTSYGNDQIAAPFASGSHRARGMVIVPCSMNTLGSIAGGLSSNLIGRAADVMLKERRPLLLAVRETPLGLTHIENMLRVTRAGAVVFPICPAYYADPASVQEINENFVMRLLDHLGLESELGRRWGMPPTRI